MLLTVNNEKIDLATIDEEADRLRPHYQSVFADQKPKEQEKQLKEWAKENVIERILLMQIARDDNRAVPEKLIESKYQEWQKNNHTDKLSDEEKIQINKDLELQLRVERIIEDTCKDLIKPAPDQARKYYTENRDKFMTSEQVRAAHIVKNINESTDEKQALKEITEIQQEIKGTGNFEAVADKHSDCPGNGGDLGYFGRGQMVQEFEDVVFSMKVNQISHIFRTPFGYHITKVLDSKPKALIGFKKVQDDIINNLHEEQKNHKVEDLLDQLKEKAKIVEKAD